MIQTIVTAAILYIATAVDLLVILLIFFAKAKTKKEYRDIYIGQYVGSVTLIVVSLFFAFVLNYVPEKWILGLLGLIPIYLGIKVAIYDDCEGEKRAKKELNEKGLSKLVGTVAIVTIASCGADNIGLFVPYFVTLSVTNLLITLFVFLIFNFFSSQIFSKMLSNFLDLSSSKKLKALLTLSSCTQITSQAFS